MCRELPFSKVCELTPNGDGFSVCSAFTGSAELLNTEYFTAIVWVGKLSAKTAQPWLIFLEINFVCLTFYVFFTIYLEHGATR